MKPFESRRKPSKAPLYIGCLIGSLPIPSMCGVLTYIRMIFMVNVRPGKYTINTWMVWVIMVYEIQQSLHNWVGFPLLIGGV